MGPVALFTYIGQSMGLSSVLHDYRRGRFCEPTHPLIFPAFLNRKRIPHAANVAIPGLTVIAIPSDAGITSGRSRVALRFLGMLLARAAPTDPDGCASMDYACTASTLPDSGAPKLEADRRGSWS